MSTVFEPVGVGEFVAKNGKSNGNGTGTTLKREARPLGLNAQKVIGKRYSLKDLNGEPLDFQRITFPGNHSLALSMSSCHIRARH